MTDRQMSERHTLKNDGIDSSCGPEASTETELTYDQRGAAAKGMNDKTKGLYNKFHVWRNDGSSDIGGKHYGCQYFVLDMTHDKHALAAIAAYSDSCESEYPLLAADLRGLYVKP